MTNEEAKMQIQAIPEKIWDQLSESDREAMEMAFSALETRIPCDLCVYNPPSRYGKPCTCCPAEPYKEDGI